LCEYLEVVLEFDDLLVFPEDNLLILADLVPQSLVLLLKGVTKLVLVQ
jgi:hypothetical protein